ncbi:MAG: cupin domain-containing protein [Oscillospiraceae bacterium]|nr:cupin domain-containing protein [Oscillospiraceae bacterium]
MDILHQNIDDVPVKHKCKHEGYEYRRQDLIPMRQANCMASRYELPPGNAAYPYHYHTQNEEFFYILSGTGTLRTPQGERPVRAGDALFFPAGEQGAHKLTNTGDEPLIYLDFDTSHPIDVALYPDSGKIGIWGKNINQVFNTNTQVDYYEGE